MQLCNLLSLSRTANLSICQDFVLYFLYKCYGKSARVQFGFSCKKLKMATKVKYTPSITTKLTIGTCKTVPH